LRNYSENQGPKWLAGYRSNRKKSFGGDGIPGEILKLAGETMIAFLARLLDITIPRYWIEAKVVPIYRAGDRSLVGNFRRVSLTSVICKQMEHIIADT